MSHNILVCSSCSYSIHDDEIFELYKKGNVQNVHHCVGCFSMYPLKQDDVWTRLNFVAKYPYYIKNSWHYVLFPKLGCRYCGENEFVPWDGTCLVCGGEMNVKEQSDLETDKQARYISRNA